jgi:hypothetical protein
MINGRLGLYIESCLKQIPGAALPGPRQVGKTTLARNVASRKAKSTTIYLDLERPSIIDDCTKAISLTAERTRGQRVMELLRLVWSNRCASSQNRCGDGRPPWEAGCSCRISLSTNRRPYQLHIQIVVMFDSPRRQGSQCRLQRLRQFGQPISRCARRARAGDQPRRLQFLEVLSEHLVRDVRQLGLNRANAGTRNVPAGRRSRDGCLRHVYAATARPHNVRKCSSSYVS